MDVWENRAYAASAWWTGKKTHEKEPERVQRRALRKVVAAFRTTPIEALEIEASIPPMDQCIRQAAVRINKLSTRNPTVQRLESRAKPVKPTTSTDSTQIQSGEREEENDAIIARTESNDE
ncbi:hypothetical protein DFS33DRAFT_1270322 [Desarmillaria ectypa]|nr:hypothetical protein DFS33DRAFT_1270322 [Desarmillaria ectypa]